MRRCAALLLLFCAACSQDDAPAEKIAEQAEAIVDPVGAEAELLAKGRIPPRDTCADIEGAAAFRRALAESVEKRDEEALVALAAEDIELDFGGGAGRAELRKRLTDPAWNLWDELDELMELGCSANEQGGVTIPSFFEEDLGSADPASAMLVTGEDVPVFEGPEADGQPVARVSWDVVEITNMQPDEPYQQVRLADGKLGYIATGNLRSMLDYRLIASSRNSKWSITSFVAGD